MSDGAGSGGQRGEIEFEIESERYVNFAAEEL